MHSVFVILYLPLHIQLYLKKVVRIKIVIRKLIMVVFAKYIVFEIEHKKTQRDMNKNHFHSTRTKHRYWVYYRNIYISCL